MADSGLQAPNPNDEISRYKVDRYIDTQLSDLAYILFSNSRTLSGTVIHLAIHLRNGQRINYTAPNATQRVQH